MCGGGPRINRTKAEPAVINMPDFDRYDREFDLQKSAIDQQMNRQLRTIDPTLLDTFDGPVWLQSDLRLTGRID